MIGIAHAETGAARPLPELVFALPAHSEQVSGGNIYNHELLRAVAARTRQLSEPIEHVRARIERGEPGFYFLDSLNLLDLLTLPPARSGQRYGLIVHHLPSLEPDRDAGEDALDRERAALARCDALLATSPFTSEILRLRGVDAKRILTVPPVALAGEPAQSINEPFTFCLVSNLIPRKGIRELFEALDAQLDASDRFHLDLAGREDIDVDYARSCLETVQGSQRLSSIVRYLGPVEHDRIAQVYRHASAFVSAATMETFGMAVQDARAFGLPILGLDGGYVRHHLSNGENGQLFASSAALASGMLELVRSPQRLRALFARSQQMRLKSDRSWAHAAESFLRQLAQCVGS
ncbi:MAG TPA: glycosyltransferase family 4 protein [Polyangiaceae bacterium]